jgi:hypothetical protein
MNDLIGILKDVDVLEVSQPSIDEVTLFADEEGPGPKLKPMRLYFDGNFKHPWNIDLAEQFQIYFKSKHIMDEQDDSEILDLFEQRFGNLRRKVTERKPRGDEDEIQVMQRITKARKERKEHQRPNSRRGTVSNIFYSSTVGLTIFSSIKPGLLSRARTE